MKEKIITKSEPKGVRFDIRFMGDFKSRYPIFVEDEKISYQCMLNFLIGRYWEFFEIESENEQLKKQIAAITSNKPSTDLQKVESIIMPNDTEAGRKAKENGKVVVNNLTKPPATTNYSIDTENQPPEGLSAIQLAVWKNEQKIKAKKLKNKSIITNE